MDKQVEEEPISEEDVIASLHHLERLGLIRIKAGSDPDNPIWEKTDMGLMADEMLKQELRTERERMRAFFRLKPIREEASR